MSETDRSDVLVTAEWVDNHLDEFGGDDSGYPLVEGDIEYDESNQWAAYTDWQFKHYGHDDVSLLDGGREYWLENDYPTSDEMPSYPEADYDAGGPFDLLRIYREGVEDVRTYDGSWTEWGSLIRSVIESETDDPASRASNG